MPVVAPSSVLPDRKDEYYKSEEEWLTAVTDAMRVEYKMIVDAGFILQIDDARFATAYDRMVPPGTFEDYRRWLEKFVEIAQPRARRHPGRPRALSRLLGKLARPACQRRAAARRRRSDPQGEGRRLRDRVRPIRGTSTNGRSGRPSSCRPAGC